MPKIEVKEPKMVIFEFRQEKDDEDYGTCMWARFYFDLVNYTMTIDSDCGNYGYGWVPTPEHESFLKLCSRFDEGYFIEKISSRSVIDSDAIWKKLECLVKETTEDVFDEEDWDMDDLKEACFSERDERGVHDAIESAIRYTKLEGLIEDFDIWDCIEKDYPSGAKKIEQVYMNYIKPAIKERLVKDA